MKAQKILIENGFTPVTYSDVCFETVNLKGKGF